jgi:hypothetical protein
MAWEDTFRTWGAAPSATEQQKMENAESAIRKAIDASTRLSTMDISVIPQGSYKARTNVRLDSDVDICVSLNSTFFTYYPEGKTDEHYGNNEGSIGFREFRNLVHTALIDYFGSTQITPGNKAFDVHSNTYRVDADVVPAFAYRHYYGDAAHHYIEPTGTAFLFGGDGRRIVNWPKQSYKNGYDKHERTGKRFRKMVRILKTLRNKMQDEKIAAAKDIGSFLIESMVWNAPDNSFNHTEYRDDVRAVLACCFNETLPKGSHADLLEVNDTKYLYGLHQAWTREQVHAFFSAAWDYIGFQ